MLEGAKRSAGKPVPPRQPLTFDILEEVGSIVRSEGSLLAWRTFWRMDVEFCALLRWEEAAALRFKDFSFHAEYMDITIWKSKTDQHRQGATVRVARHKEAPQACPVNITLIFMRMLKYPNGFNGSMQPRILRDNQGQRGCTQCTICYSRALQDLKELITRTGRDAEKFDEHSGRQGGATAAAEAGAKWADLKKLGRWASDAAPQLYVDNTEGRKSKLPVLLAAAAQERIINARGRGPRSRHAVTIAAEGSPSFTILNVGSDTADRPISVVLPPAGRATPAGLAVILPSMQ